MGEAVKKLLHHIGEDPERNGLVRTPDRYARALLFFTKGCSEDIHEVVNDAIFEVDHQNLVLVKDIEIFSMCEHHMVPFMGKVCQYLKYIDLLYVTQLTPLRYTLDIFPINTYWVCQNWLASLKSSLDGSKCKSVLHKKWLMRSTKCYSPRVWRWCMVMRGIQKAGAITTTCSRIGLLQDDQKAREEFNTLLNVGQRI